MKLSIGFDVAKALFSENIERAAEALKTVGFDGVDLGFCEFPLEQVFTKQWDAAIKKQVNILRGAGMEIFQCHLHYQPSHEPLGNGSYEVFEEVFLPVWLKEIQLCSEIGCKIAVAHLFFCDDPRKTFEGNKVLLEKLLPELCKRRVNLAIENVYGWGEEYADCGITTAPQIMRYIELFNTEHIGACLDSGHAVCTGNDPVKMAQHFGRHLIATHINSSSGRDTHLFPGTLSSWIDPTDYVLLSETLKSIGYEGVYNLEVSSGQYPCNDSVGKAYLALAAQVAKRYTEVFEKVV